MRYAPSTEPVDLASITDFVIMYQLAVVSEEQVAGVREVAEREPPLSARNRRLVRENCQGWVVRVVVS